MLGDLRGRTSAAERSQHWSGWSCTQPVGLGQRRAGCGDLPGFRWRLRDVRISEESGDFARRSASRKRAANRKRRAHQRDQWSTADVFRCERRTACAIRAGGAIRYLDRFRHESRWRSECRLGSDIAVKLTVSSFVGQLDRSRCRTEESIRTRIHTVNLKRHLWTSNPGWVWSASGRK